ncbi:target of EGR1 protein 1 [Periophthalmus magnuspinnatus]|uniref:target of EGR1 protein 1 n=1 Tax=Periophthalmus magnuspinnatus TaxID=409849 RepID=UPI00145C16BC|nr:target of EGR1 protein 1 [Periophthalmus magnuspinnatus]
MSSFVVPVIDVHNDNFKELWPAMVVALKTSSFIALDTELSGLGNRKSLLAESIEDRYKAICHAARSRSILSLGFACYKKLDNRPADSYLVQVYNLTLLCSEEYIIEPQSVQFLVQHGFDFNKQYAHGIPYFKGNYKAESDYQGVHIRALFTELLRARKPLVLHNGLIDMAFLYQSFYAHLPEQLATFTADLSEMFPAGIYDTKYVTEFELRLTASYLEYAYKKCKLDNFRGLTSGAAGPHVQVEFCQYGGHMSSYVDFRECSDVISSEAHTEICERFSAFGWCPNGTQCPLSHDTDLIVLQDEKNKEDKRKKRKRQRNKKKAGENTVDSSIFEGAPENKIPHMEIDVQEQSVDEPNETDKITSSVTTSDLPTIDTGNGVESMNKDVMKKSPIHSPQKKKQDTGTHRAGFDAFMTGYIFAHSCVTDQKSEEGEARSEQPKQDVQLLPSSLNKVYLSGKSVPLNIVKSTFAKSSKAHVQKMERVWESRH